MCKKCQKHRQKLGSLYELQVNLLDDLSEAVQLFLEAEEMQQGNYPFCDHCSANTPHTAQTYILRPPKVLIVQIRRYLFTQRWFRFLRGLEFFVIISVHICWLQLGCDYIVFIFGLRCISLVMAKICLISSTIVFLFDVVI